MSKEIVRLYSGLTVLASLTCALVFLQLIRLGLNGDSNSDFGGDGFVVGSVWLTVPVSALVMIAAAHFPSFKPKTQYVLSVTALSWVMFFAVIPLCIVLYGV